MAQSCVQEVILSSFSYFWPSECITAAHNAASVSLLLWSQQTAFCKHRLFVVFHISSYNLVSGEIVTISW